MSTSFQSLASTTTIGGNNNNNNNSQQQQQNTTNTSSTSTSSYATVEIRDALTKFSLYMQKLTLL